MAAGLGVICLLALAFLYSHPPTSCRWFPGCPINRLTGLYCAGCGGTRALYALLHGDVAEACRKNILFVLSLPAAAFWCADGRLWKRRLLTPGRPQAVAVTVVVVLILLFCLLRNLPCPPFSLLAPH